MGKKRTRDESPSTHGSPKKKHKKNKHKSKHKEHPHPITLKIKLGDKYIGTNTTSEATVLDDASSMAESESLSLEQSVGVSEDWEGSDISVGNEEFEALVAVDDDEEAWLEALESGDVNERGYLPAKNNASLTARQKALLGGDENEALLELPLRKKAKMSEEDLIKKLEKNQKRKVAALKRREKRKAETVQKLIEKQATKKKDEEKVVPVVKSSVPHIRYISSTRPLLEGVINESGVQSLLSLPVGVDYPIGQRPLPSPTPSSVCTIEGCGQARKYADSATKLPLCSLECYRTLKTREHQ